MTEPNTDRRAEEARQIHAAIERLLTGTPQQSSGRLSVVALANEAGLKRTTLYDHHRELVDSFLTSAGRNRAVDNAVNSAELATARARITELEQLVASQETMIRTLRTTLVELSLRDPSDVGTIRLVR